MGMDAKLLSRARGILAERRQSAQVTANLHLQEISEKIPEIVTLKAELAQTGAELVRVMLAKPKNIEAVIEEIKTRNLAIQDRITDLLLSHGYPERYLKVAYHCAACEDTGYVGGKPCTCLNQLVKQLNTESMNAMSPLALSEFESFELSYYPDELQGNINQREQMKKVYQYCLRYAENFQKESPSLLLYGNTGLGKTHLSLAIAKKVLGKGYSAIYGSAQDLFRQVEREHFGRDQAEKDTIGGLLGCDLLVLDDLGAEFESSYYISCLYHIINSRYSLKKPTIVSTNLTPKQLQERYPDRIVSRLLAGSQHLQFVGKDIRQIKMIKG